MWTSLYNNCSLLAHSLIVPSGKFPLSQHHLQHHTTKKNIIKLVTVDSGSVSSTSRCFTCLKLPDRLGATSFPLICLELVLLSSRSLLHVASSMLESLPVALQESHCLPSLQFWWLWHFPPAMLQCNIKGRPGSRAAALLSWPGSRECCCVFLLCLSVRRLRIAWRALCRSTVMYGYWLDAAAAAATHIHAECSFLQ